MGKSSTGYKFYGFVVAEKQGHVAIHITGEKLPREARRRRVTVY